jgi:hypothetical protein
MKIHPMEAMLFHADGWTGGLYGQTYMTKLIFAFRNIANGSKILLRTISHCFTNLNIRDAISPKPVQIILIIYNLGRCIKTATVVQ